MTLEFSIPEIYQNLGLHMMMADLIAQWIHRHFLSDIAQITHVPQTMTRILVLKSSCETWLHFHVLVSKHDRKIFSFSSLNHKIEKRYSHLESRDWKQDILVLFSKKIFSLLTDWLSHFREAPLKLLTKAFGHCPNSDCDWWKLLTDKSLRS